MAIPLWFRRFNLKGWSETMEQVAVRMKSNISELVDFEKLKKCNDRCFYWSKRLRIERRDYMKFILKIHKDNKSILEKLKSKYHQQYLEDCKTMFYASQVEDLLLEQYHAMIFSIMKKMRVDPFKKEYYLTDGFLAIRSATWQYRTYKVKASFSTFVHKAIFLRIKGQLHRESEKKERRKNFHLSYESDIDTEAFNLNGFPSKQLPEYFNYNQDIGNILKDSGLSERENCILQSYINRKVDSLWYEDYRKRFLNEKTKRPFSRQSIYNQLLAAQTKVMESMMQKNILPDNFKIPTIHRGDLR